MVKRERVILTLKSPSQFKFKWSAFVELSDRCWPGGVIFIDCDELVVGVRKAESFVGS
jgi:hypothetical protein